MIIIRIIIASLLLPIAWLWGEEARPLNITEHKLIGAILSLKTDFDIYKVRHENRAPYTYSYMIMPAPESGVGGRFYTYLGRMPKGTLLEIVSAEKGKRGKGKLKLRYKVKPLSEINNKIKGNISWEVHPPDVPLKDQIFSLSSIGFGLGIYAKEDYPDGSPKLNETWFEIIKINEKP